HLDFVAAIDRAGRTLFLVDAQHVAKIGRTVTENGEILAHALLQQAEHQRFGKRRLDDFRYAAGSDGRLHTAGFGDGAGARPHVAAAVAFRAARQHHVISSPAPSRLSGWDSIARCRTSARSRDARARALPWSAPCRRAWRAWRRS